MTDEEKIDHLMTVASQFWRRDEGPCMHPDPAIRRAVDEAEAAVAADTKKEAQQ